MGGWDQKIIWSGDGVTASAETAVTARWTARQARQARQAMGSQSVAMSGMLVPYIATAQVAAGCAVSERLRVCSDLKPGALGGAVVG